MTDQIDNFLAKIITRETHKGSVNRVRIYARAEIERMLVEARKDEVELAAAIRAYEAGFGASEFDSFLTDSERDRIAQLTSQPNKENKR